MVDLCIEKNWYIISIKNDINVITIDKSAFTEYLDESDCFDLNSCFLKYGNFHFKIGI